RGPAEARQRKWKTHCDGLPHPPVYELIHHHSCHQAPGTGAAQRGPPERALPAGPEVAASLFLRPEDLRNSRRAHRAQGSGIGMEDHGTAVDAWVLSKNKKYSLTAKIASKYSLWVRFEDQSVFKDGSEFSQLTVLQDDRSFELGPCRLISEPNIEGYSGRLVLSRDFHDLESVLFRGKQVKLQTSFLNLASLLEHK